MSRSILVIGDHTYFNYFTRYGTCTNDLEKIPTVDMVVFTGGADVNPKLYAEPQHASTQPSDFRDKVDLEAWYVAKDNNIPCVGICRGAQFLCVVNGGELVQDVTNHGFAHDMVINDGRVIKVTSSHHQMMVPSNGELLGYSLGLSSHYEDGYGGTKDIGMGKRGVRVREPEEVYWKRTKSLGVQYHPEWGDPVGMAPMKKRFETLLEALIFK